MSIGGDGIGAFSIGGHIVPPLVVDQSVEITSPATLTMQRTVGKIVATAASATLTQGAKVVGHGVEVVASATLDTTKAIIRAPIMIAATAMNSTFKNAGKVVGAVALATLAHNVNVTKFARAAARGLVRLFLPRIVSRFTLHEPVNAVMAGSQMLRRRVTQWTRPGAGGVRETPSDIMKRGTFKKD